MNKRRKTTRRTSKSSFQMPKMPSIEIKKSTQNELVGVIYILLAVVATMSLLGLAGPLGYLIVGGLTYLFGIAVWLFPIIFFAMGLVLVMFHKRYGVSSAKILGLILITCAILGFIHITGGTYGVGGDYQLAGYEESAELGGLIGFITATTLYFPLQETATKVILVFAFLAGIILVFDLSLYNIFRMFKNGTPKIITKDDDVEVRGQANKLRVVAPKSTAKIETKPEKTQAEPKKKKSDLVRVLTNEPKKPKLNISLTSKKYTDWEFPSLDLLDSSTSSVVRDDKFLQEKAEQIKHKLEQFGINVTMQDVHLGPTVMQYTLRPSDGVKLSKITTLKSDLALALAAESVRIEAPIPGKALVGIEVPNKKRSTVRLHEILTSDEFRKTDSQLKIPIGSAADGTPIIGELDKMPHLLVAGQTGSGKSVGINTILISLLYQNSPADLRLILVDPKRVELTPYNAIPHLLTPVIVEPEKTIAALRWAVSEMTRRYKLCAENHARNIKEYNTAHSDEKLPYVVIVIDELADLMMVAGKEVEALICRIAQMARAVGIHLIIATQRPSVDVITGLIKANIPTRVAFTVASGVDSRTIIDTVGAEDLLGMGDMLYLTSEIGKPVRVQGVYIDTEEVKRVTNKIKLTREPEYITEEIVEQPHEDVQIPGYQPVEATGNETDDELVEKAVQVMRETRKASASLFQRRLSLGYARAARILDLLEEKGYVGPVNGAKPREIFLPEEDNQNEPQG
jgi:S-DNA-T family DNA segregation ATPase FtsK/SpoIIIE